MIYNITDKNSDILDLLLKAKEQGITVFLEDGRVRLKVKEGVELTDAFLKKLKEEKERIQEFLESEAGQYKESSYVKNEIKPYDRKNNAKIPLSFAQERLWFIDKLQGSKAYHIPGVLRIKGELNIDLLHKALKALITRHESLRTVYRDEDGIGYQHIMESNNFELAYIPKLADNVELSNFIDTVISQPFDLSKDYVLRATIIAESQTNHVLILVVHHIASDGWSLPIMISELETYYQSLNSGTTANLAPLPIQYADYSIWQRNYLSGKILEDKLAYWKTKLENAAVLELPTDYIRPAVKSTEGAMYRFKIDEQTSKALNEITKKNGATLFMLLLSAYKVLLYRYTQQTDISVGTPIANREQEEIAGLIGFFINTIVLRDHLNVEGNFTTLLQQVKQTCLSAYTHQDIPFEQIVDHLSVERDQSRSPLFQTMFVFQNTEEVAEMSFGESMVETVATTHTTAQFDLMFNARETSSGIAFSIEYVIALFKEETIARIAKHFEQLLLSIAQNPESTIGSLTVLLDEEKTQLLEVFNNTAIAYSEEETVVSLFATQVAKKPEATALVFDDTKLTYKELDEKSNQVANYLISKGVITNSLVPICIERSLEMHIGILGILKAGGAYVPIDTKNPVERIEFILHDINAEVILTDSTLSGIFENLKKEVFFLDQLEENLSAKAANVKIIPSQLAYAIYTSGTTGLPKGVKNAHSGLLNRLYWMQEDVNITNNSVLLQKTPYVFDVSVWELLMPLISGCTLVIAKPEGHKDPIYLQNVIEKHQVSLIHFVPSMLAVFTESAEAEKCKSLENIVCSGEALPVQMVKDFKAKFSNTGIRNYYGPTEAAIDVTSIDLTHEDYEVTIPIGKPVANTNIYIVGEDMSLSPIGVSGELLIGGIQVSEGYINREELTKEKFIASPFKTGERLYKTGDIAKWLSDGNIAYIGRKDDQIKLRGYRIELGEITAALDQIAYIKQSLVVVREDKGSKQLVAYVVSEEEIDSKSIQKVLGNQLPEYMIPKLYIQLEGFPLTTNGKINRKALPAPMSSDYQTAAYVAPTTEIEQTIVSIWEEQLEIAGVGIHDNFFELGGDSIKIIRLISVVNKQYGTSIEISSFYQSPTVSSLVGLIENTNKEDQTATYLAIEQEIEATALSVRNNHSHSEGIENIYPMSDIQVGMVLTSEMMRLDGELGIYHDQMVSQIGSVDIPLMEKALKLMVQKHEILRTSFHLYDYSKPVQIIYKEIDVTIKQHHLLDKNSDEQETYINEFLLKEREEHIFEVTKAPLWRVDFFEIGTSDSMFVFQFHHAIMDGWSDKSFRSELMETYFELKQNKNYKPVPLAIGIKESVISDMLELRNEENITYWKNTLSDYKRLDILTDERYYRQTNKVYTAKFLQEILDKCKKDKIAPKSLFFAGYLYVLSLFSLEKDITIGAVANRRPVAEDGDKLLGCFLNTVPFRHTVTTNKETWASYVNSVAVAYQALQGRDRFSLVEIAKMHKESAEGNPFFDVLFNYVDFYVVDKLIDSEVFESHIAETQVENLAVSGFERTNTYLDFTANLTNNQLIISMNQIKRLKSGHTVDDLLIYFDSFLNNYLHHSNDILDTTKILLQKEQQEVLEDFNATTITYDDTKSIIDIFSSQVKNTPNAAAVEVQNEILTYKELDEKSNQLAQYLHKKGIKKGSLIPICMERSEELVIGILAILKVGAAYVPIDPTYPKARIEFMLEDIAAKIVLTQNTFASLFSEINKNLEQVCLDDVEVFENELKTMVNVSISPESLAYIIYTSGTTGTPKGVMITHSNLHNLTSWHQSAYGLTDKSKALLFSGISFDASVWELFPYLLSGGCVFPIEEAVRLDVEYIINFINDNDITHAYMPTALYASIRNAETSLKSVKLLLGGEALKMNKLPENVEIYNNYGPTENTVVATYHKVTELKGIIPIGKPISNTQAYILDENLQLVPKGAYGELCLSGKSLSSGYLNRPELTIEKFVAHPFKEGERLYRTGDVARWLPDGNLEFIGRQDNQVKIRGYRIELGEIEASLDQLMEITQSVVVTKKDASGNNQLVAYFTSLSEVDTTIIQSKLGNKLPSYMVPKLYMQLESFSLTANGKIDRKRLPELKEEDYITTSYIAPETEKEIQLATIWQELLGVEKIGVLDNFFELGGHSLLAIRLTSYIKSEFKVVVSVRDIFATPTIKSLVDTIKNATISNIPEIVVQERPTHIPLSYAQERLWFVDKLQGSNAFHIPGVLQLNGELNIALFTKAMKVLVQRHESLRTIFKEHEGVGYQYIMSEDAYEVTYISELPKGESLPNLIDQTISKTFDLAKDYMLRSVVVKESEANHVLILVIHHIASDGWSLPILVKELEATYQSLLKGEEVLLDPLPVQYADYSIWQRNYLSGEVLETKLAYWLGKLKGAAPLELPTDFPRPEIQSLDGAMYRFTLETDVLNDLNTFSKTHGTTLFMTLLSIYKVLLYKYSGQLDISVGTPIANREQLEISKLIGFFVNTIVLRDTFTSEVSFSDFLAQVKQTCLNAYSHQDVPFERIVDHLGIERDRSRSTLFQTEFILQNNEEVSEVSLGENQLEMLETKHTSAQFDILMNATETPFGLAIGFEYATALFKEETIVQMASHFKELVQSVLKDANQSLSALEILSNEEKYQLLETFNTTTVVYEKDQTVIDLFESQVKRVPNEKALVHENTVLTYKELNEKANRFAHYLKNERHVKPNDLVGVMMNRSEWAIISILGILKSGAGYVPIDIEFPYSRKEFIVEESGLTTLVVNSESLFDVLEFNINIISIDIEFESFPNDDASTQNLELESATSDLSYVIYTSGSTGEPKGVMVAHKNFANMVQDHSKRFDITENDCVSQFTSFSFDVSASEIFMSLVSGSCLVLLNKSLIEDGEQFVSYLENQGVTIAHIPPSYLISLDIKRLSFLKVLVVGGESPNLDVVLECAKNTAVYNAYGPTECTVCSTIYKVEPYVDYHSQLPIGKPISNTQIYIVDEQLEIVPTGIVGELCIAGTGLTKGYLNQPELTAEKFIPNPFKEGERLYKTGDLAKWRSDGNIEFIGRKDHQVKIRGYRIELGEIEAALEKLNGVNQSVVIVHENKAEIKELVAYVTLENGQDVTKLKTMLQDRLPDYMIPKLYVKLEAFPLTTNSKIDRKALPAPEASAYQLEEYVAPTTETEIKLAAILQELLGVPKVGIHDNFFELGGHSVLAIRLVSHIQSKFRVAFNVKDVFATPTVAELAITISEGKVSEVPPISAKERPKYIPLSFAQERLWFIDKLQGSVAYHMPEVMRIKGELDVKILSQAVKALVKRHESLRTVIKEHEGIGYQHIMSANNFDVAYHDKLPKNLEEFIAAETGKPFNLANDYMLRVTVIKETENGHILIFVLHHISSDGWSIPLFVNELEANYEQLVSGKEATLAELPIQYADYSIWQREYLSGEVLDNKMAYWKNKLEDLKPLELPVDYTRPAIQSLDGSMHQFMIDGVLQEKLKEVSQESGATLFMTLLSIYKILLYRYTGSTDISVGSPIANREQVEIAELIGFFINTLVLRDEFEKDTSFVTLLEQVKNTCLEAYSHQDIPFEFIVDHLQIERDQSRSPLFQTLFALQNNEEVTGMNLGESKLEMLQQEFTTSKFDLSFNAVETDNGIACSITYTTALFKEETIRRMSEHFVQLIHSVLDDIDQSIDTLNLLTEHESKQLLQQFGVAKTSLAKGENIVNRFETQVQQTPNVTAIHFEGKQLTYRELDERANQVANCLLDKGVTKETLVPICLNPSFETLIGILGVLKAGAAYVPVDSMYPTARIAYILDDIKATLLLSTSEIELASEINNVVEIIQIDQLSSASFSTTKPKVSIAPEQLAYIIYTSGTTGKPKGVMVEHHSIYSHLDYMGEYYELNTNDKFILFSNITFDASIEQLFLPILNGCPLHMVSKTVLFDAHHFVAYINEHEITHLHATPSFLNLLEIEQLTTVKRIVSGGEACPIHLVKRCVAKGEFYNKYGPTETTIAATVYSANKDTELKNPIPIGKSISNRTLYILDEDLNMLPIGIVGELFISGSEVARGYLNKQELTSEKFIENPFVKGERLYKTGDSARWLADGNVAFIGRQDHQVKIRGYRIELGEIETTINQLAGIKTSLVTVLENETTKQLIAYIIAEDSIDSKQIQEQLQEKLPEYMVPSVVVKLNEFPLTTNGKIARNKLPIPTLETSETKVYTAPTTPTEIGLVNVWQDLLNVDKIGIHDNFFELGGDSIMAIQLVSRSKTAGYNYRVRDIFNHQTIAKIARQLKSNIPIIQELGVLKGEVPLHPIQKEFFAKKYEAFNHYNQSVLLKISKKVSKEVLETTLQELISHHDALRFKYTSNIDAVYPVQMYSDELSSLHTTTIESLDDIHAVCETYQASLDIFEGELLKAVFIETPEAVTENRFFITIHHLAIDGVSWRILLEDLTNTLESLQNGITFSLPEKGTSYRQWTEKLTTYTNSEILVSEFEYWKNVVANYSELPVDKTYDQRITFQETGEYSVRLNADMTKSLLHDVNQVYQTEINDILLSALVLACKGWIDASNIVIALEGHGREELFDGMDINRTVGWFTSIYPVSLSIPQEVDDYENIINTTKNTIRSIPNKGIGFGMLRHLSASEEVQNTLAVFKKEIVFNYLGNFENSFNTGEKNESLIGFANESSGTNIGTSNRHSNKLVINSLIQEGCLQLNWSYDAKRYNAATIEKLAKVYILELEKLISHCNQLENQEDKHIVVFQSEGVKAPIFMIPPLGGTSFVLENFSSQFTTERPIYGLEMEGIFEGEAVLTSMEAIAAKNIERVKTVQPKGPYIMAGYSFGGSVVYEMAKQLENEGEKVVGILLDQAAYVKDDEIMSKNDITRTAINGISEAIKETEQEHKLPIGWQDDLAAKLDTKDANKSWQMIMEYMKRNHIELPSNINTMGRIFKLFIANTSLDYKVTGNIKNMILVKSEREVPEDSTYLRWDHFKQQVHMIHAKGNHHTMLQEENGKALAIEIQTKINKLLNE